MSDPPQPFTPEDCDLRGMEWMPLFGARLFMSDFEARATDEEFRAAVRLWWMAWQQVPAASLPSDDAVLCRLSGYGRDMKGWLKAKEAVLHGFTLCSDGRVYHKLLASQANEAWERRLRERERKAAYRTRKSNGGNGTGSGQDEDVPRDRTRTMTGTGPPYAMGQNADGYGDVRVDRTRQDRTVTGQEKKESERGALARDAHSLQEKIHSDWFPDDEGLDCAKRAGIADVAETIGHFVDFYSRDGTPMADWQAAWRVWCRRETQFRKVAR